MKLLIFCVFPLLTACALGGGHALSTAPSSGPGTWPDYSAQVESVGGQNPAKFFIANGPALNAVDADGNGLWDDVEERLRTSATVAALDPRLVSLKIRTYQHSLMSRTRDEAKQVFRLLEHSTACALHLGGLTGATREDVNRTISELSREVEAAVFVSKQRVLAAAYASALASGGKYTVPRANAESCAK